MNPKSPSPKAREALQHIRSMLMQSGRIPSVRQLGAALGYKSPRSALLILRELEAEGFLKRRSDGTLMLIKDLPSDRHMARTVAVPLVGSVSCGMPLLAEENIEGLYPVSIELARPGAKYFLLRAKGDSMNEADVEDGDWLLIRQQQNACDGERVVALIDDEAVVKEFRRQGNAIVLRPRSSNPQHRPIILTEDFQVLGIVVASLSRIE